MYNIFFQDKIITFTNTPPSFDGVVLNVGNSRCPEITKVLQKVENSKSIAVVAPDIDNIFSDFCSQFRIVEAGGGVVERTNGDILMILRGGKWDLPKGHREAGEPIDVCAMREVEEECGISGFGNLGMVAQTMHIYQLGEHWILKKCSWFRMKYDGYETPLPQIEEGIERVEWVEPGEATKRAEDSYATIKYVLDKYFCLL